MLLVLEWKLENGKEFPGFLIGEGDGITREGLKCGH